MKFLGGLFDLNGDGKTDSFEMGLAFAAMQAAADEEQEQEEEEDDLLVQTGYEASELALMDPEERREILEESGLDPDDFDCDGEW
jgi:2-hydroxychromene-2-carboxylate isomerase